MIAASIYTHNTMKVYSKMEQLFAESKKYIEDKESEIDPWENSPFKFITKLTNDARGSWGEHFLANMLEKMYGCDVLWDDAKNINQNDGTYDLLVNGKRLEVKTAYIGKNNSWQHEGILCSKDEYDLLVLVDIDYSCVHITFITSKYIFEWAPQQVQDPIFGKKFTLRKKEEDKYKFDFSRRSIDLAKKANLSASCSHDSAGGELEQLIREFIYDIK